MVRFLLRHGLIRVVGRRAVPALMVWDVIMVANRVRRIPVVDRGLRRGAAAAADRFASTLEGFAPNAGAPSADATPEGDRPDGRTRPPGWRD